MTSLPLKPEVNEACLGFFKKYGCTAQAWIGGWAIAVYVSAAFQTFATQNTARMGNIFYAIFQTADDVPPAGKLTLGGLMAFGIVVLAWRDPNRNPRSYYQPQYSVVIVTTIAMVGALILPVGYYPTVSQFNAAVFALHCLAGALGGVTIIGLSKFCIRRNVKKNRCE